MAWKIGTMGGSPVGMPKNQADQVECCSNPDSSYSYAGMTMTCSQWIQTLNQGTTFGITWYGD